MLFFIDESWQTTEDGKNKVGVLSAAQIQSHKFNEISTNFFKLKTQHLGSGAGDVEIKGHNILREYLFNLEQKKGVPSKELNLAREILGFLKVSGITLFGSIALEKEEMDLACADVRRLERPFFFLFERIDLFMKENHPGMMATLIFDDRGVQTNEKISASVSNFFHKSYMGQTFDNIIKVPCFAISTQNIGLQIADIVAYILGGEFTAKSYLHEFYQKLKESEFKSRKLVDVGGKSCPTYGFKFIKKKEAGDLPSSGRAE